MESGPQQKSPAELARDWYSQDIFKNYAGLLDPEDIAPSKRQKVAPQDLSDSDSDEADEPAEDDGPGIADDDDASDQLLETKRTSLSSGKVSDTPDILSLSESCKFIQLPALECFTEDFCVFY